MSTYDKLLIIQYCSIVLMLIMCVYVMRKWKKVAHSWLFFYTMATLINNAGYLAIMKSKTENAATLSWQFSYLGRVWIPFAMLHFVIMLCNKKSNKIISGALSVFNIITYLLVLSLHHNKLYYTSFEFVKGGLFPHIVHTNGIWHYMYSIIVIIYIGYGLSLLIKRLLSQTNNRKRKQLIFIIAAILVDSIFYALELIHLVPGYDMTACGYTIATIFFYLAIFKYDMLGTKELATDFVMDQISEGVIITDENGVVVRYNKKAKSIIPIIENEPVKALEQIIYLIENNHTLDIGEKKYTPKENKLIDENQVTGKVYMFTDDTEHYRRAESLTREMMLALSKTVDAKDHYTNGHSKRVAEYSKEIARRMGKDEQELETIYEMGLLHDIGKIGVNEDIINKTSRLTDEEFAKIKEHTVIGYNILKQISVMPELASGARSHHERYNGKGYPDGLKGDEIPEAARIICLADCYDAMTSTRTYAVPKSQAEARAEIERCKGSQFDPYIADIMISIIDDDKDYKMHE